MRATWTVLPRSERATIGHFEFDAWATGPHGARWTVLDRNTNRYVRGGEARDVEAAKAAAVKVVFG